MNILYHLTIPPPRMPGTDAVVKETEALRAHFGGKLVYLNPNRRCVYVPRIAFGFHKLLRLHAWERDVDLHHVFNPDPYPFPVLRTLHRPIVYSLTGGVSNVRPNVALFSTFAAVTVSDERSLERLRSWGLDNALLVRPGTDTSAFTHAPLPLRSQVRLLVGSAPWNRAQFRQKGIDALLAAARRAPDLALVFLWRGVLADEMERRVRRLGLQGQVEVLNRKVDVNRVLAGVHAAVSLATDPAVIRPYPHSLIESLAAGKPVIVSRCIPMADDVERMGCGLVVDSADTADILSAVESLVRGYEALQTQARRAGQSEYTLQAMIASVGRVYERVRAQTDRG
jgi:glycosyltransferase involved in cell wall biosynthesis